MLVNCRKAPWSEAAVLKATPWKPGAKRARSAAPATGTGPRGLLQRRSALARPAPFGVAAKAKEHEVAAA